MESALGSNCGQGSPRTRESLATASQFTAPGRQPNKAQLLATTLLYFVQLLIDQHRYQHQEKYSGTDAEHTNRKDKPVDLGQQLRLLFLHVRIMVIQKQLIVLVHSERALVDQEDDQTDGENSKYNRHYRQRHKPPRQVLPKYSGFPLRERGRRTPHRAPGKP